MSGGRAPLLLTVAEAVAELGLREADGRALLDQHGLIVRVPFTATRRGGEAARTVERVSAAALQRLFEPGGVRPPPPVVVPLPSRSV